MKITIETDRIDDKLFKPDIENKFQDFFGRVIADIADSLNTGTTMICGRYELETACFLKRVFYDAKYEINKDGESNV